MSGTNSDPKSRAPVAATGTVVPRDAATIMLVRDAQTDEGPALEVCMLQRHLDSDFVGGAYVFPGGKVDDADRGAPAEAVCNGRTDAEASEMLEIASGGLAFWVAALRECFEEAGVLLAYQARSGPESMVDATDHEVRRELASLRSRLNTGSIGFLEACESEGFALAVDRVHYFSHWITPEPAPKRYDTRFFVAALPQGQVPVHDDHETIDTVWVRPAEALRRARDGEFDLIFPTMKNLQAIGRFATSAQLLAAAAAIERVPTIVPRVVADERGFRILLPGDVGYEEAMDASAAPGGSADPASHKSGGDGTRTTLSPSEVNAIVRTVDVDGVSHRRDD